MSLGCPGMLKSSQILAFIPSFTDTLELLYSSLPNRRVARNKHGVGEDELFLISVVPGISMVVRIFRPVTVIKRRTK